MYVCILRVFIYRLKPPFYYFIQIQKLVSLGRKVKVIGLAWWSMYTHILLSNLLNKTGAFN